MQGEGGMENEKTSLKNIERRHEQQEGALERRSPRK